MQKQEFEERIERTVTDEQYKVIEEVYMWHPSIRNTSGKGRYKKSQPVGYENAKVMIDILLEDTKTATTLEQLTEMQRLFKPYGQDKPKLLPIVNEDCAVRGITKVYFKNLTSKKVISESKRIASLELWAPDIAGIKVKKKTTKKKTTKKSTKKSKSKKSKSKSPAKDSRNTSRGKKAARAAVK